MATSVAGVFAAGDCTEIPHGVTNVPRPGALRQPRLRAGQGGRHQRRPAGSRTYQPVYVPWGMVAGKWMIGGVSFGETLADRARHPLRAGRGRRASPGPATTPASRRSRSSCWPSRARLRLIGAQMVGGEGIKERADFLAMAVKTGITLEDLAFMENVYSPPIGALNEPIALAAQNALSRLGA